MTDISRAAAALNRQRKKVVGGFKDRQKAKEASAKGVAARKLKREQNKAVEELK